MMLGRIAEVDGDYIATEFFAGILPTACMYVPQAGVRSTKTAGNGRVRIQIDWSSVLLGYARLWLPVFAVAAPALGVASGHLAPATWGLSAVLVLMALASRRVGHLSESEKAQLRVLGTVAGLRIDPARLQPATREVKRDLLGQLMTRAGIPTTPDGVLSVLDDIPIPAMPLVFGYARYAGDTPEWRECAALVYARYESAEK
jgi:hypothetical protein